ncbi:MAG: SCO family protein, partial [Gammaproteobacteria bacterium]|nr:SCO family protein [Gammaproteobacteria bacterium]
MTTQADRSLVRAAILLAVTVVVLLGGLAFAFLHHDDFNDQIRFTLQNHKQQTVSESDLAGQWLLVYFGYTHCPDICPTQMYKLAEAFTVLDKSGDGDAVKTIFISVDPRRDTLSKLKQYVEYFDPRFIGMTGNQSQLRLAASSFDAYYDVPADAGPEENYDVSHPSIVYFVD